VRGRGGATAGVGCVCTESKRRRECGGEGGDTWKKSEKIRSVMMEETLPCPSTQQGLTQY
jgi:hypothetical protein